MQRTQAQMSGFSIGYGRFHRFQRTNLADQNDIRSLPHGTDQSGFETIRVKPYFPLSYDRFFMPVHELNRIFDGEDVSRLGRISMVDHGRERRRLARPCGSYDQNQTAFQ